MHIYIRRATDKDLDSIVRIYNEIIAEKIFTADLDQFEVNERINWFRETNIEQYGVFVVCNNEIVIGYFYFSPWRKGRRALQHVAEVSFYLHKDFRGKGMGQKMMDHILVEAANRKFTSLLAILLDINLQSRKLMEKSGFVVVGHLPDIVFLKNQTCGQLMMMRGV